MTPRLTLATAARVLTQVRHDPRTIGLLIVVPALLVGLIAWIFDDTPVFDQVGPEVLLDVLIVAAFALGALVLAALTLRRRTP